jgi:hypothetical protein
MLQHCKAIAPDKHWREMHLFEGCDWTVPAAFSAEELDAQMQLRYDRIKTCNRTWGQGSANALFKWN